MEDDNGSYNSNDNHNNIKIGNNSKSRHVEKKQKQ